METKKTFFQKDGTLNTILITLAKLEKEKSLTSGQDILRVLKISKFRKTEMLVPSVKVSSENQ